MTNTHSNILYSKTEMLEGSDTKCRNCIRGSFSTGVDEELRLKNHCVFEARQNPKKWNFRDISVKLKKEIRERIKKTQKKETIAETKSLQKTKH